MGQMLVDPTALRMAEKTVEKLVGYSGLNLVASLGNLLAGLRVYMRAESTEQM